jgi:wyosine [tRNA(Phe)-imidazoG37] synthetase (radical SAM superfamily)
MITFGPVPSRRLGRSLGINNIPPKACSYSCLYCQIGPTPEQEVEPRTFYPPEQIRHAVAGRVAAARQAGERIDYLTFVPDGEPTLDINLGETIELLRPLDIKIAVISNASLVWREEVREALKKADWLSLKVDTTDEAVWRRINRPHRRLQLDRILEGIERLAREYVGQWTTETMLVQGVNDSDQSITHVAEYLTQLGPCKAYLAVPTRPPAEQTIHSPTEESINRAYQIMNASVANLEYLIGYEGNVFAQTGDLEDNLLSITSVHPMREEAVKALLVKAGTDWDVVRRLIGQGKLKEIEYQGKRFYVRKLLRVGLDGRIPKLEEDRRSCMTRGE